jgi:hypothetical protein
LQDIGSRLTDCVNNQRTLFYFWKPPATCLPSAEVAVLPQPVTGLPCDVTCQPGSFFNTTSRQCQACRGGSFVESSHVSVEQWLELKPQMNTYCEKFYNARECNAWRLQGSYIDSGDNMNNHMIRSNLEYNVEITNPVGAYVSFEYKVSAENFYDFLIFSVNKQQAMKVSNTDWTEFKYNFTHAGFYNLQWSFSKDISYSYGEDMAKVRKIDIRGTSDFATQCFKCPKGKYSNGQTPCTPCPVNTYAPNEGMTQCLQCPPATSSFPGSSSCFVASLPCLETDIYLQKGKCDPATLTRTVTPSYIQPQLCNASANGSVPLRPAYTESCSLPTCLPGQKLNAAGDCEYCPAGTSSAAGSTSCTACGAGHASLVKYKYFNSFKKSDFKTGCTGQCQSGGWRFADTFMDSGLGNGVSESFVTFDVQNIKTTNTTIAVDYTLSCLSGAMDITVNGAAFESISCGGCTDLTQKKQVVIALPNNDEKVTIGINYRTFTVMTQDAYACDRAIVHGITVTGSAEGGSATCDICPAGSFSRDAVACDLCPAGTSSVSGSSNCTDCPVNTFSQVGAPKCTPCGNGTYTNGTRSTSCGWSYGTCAYEASVMGIQRRFEWNTIDAEMAGQAYAAQNERDSTYYFNLCGHNRTVCGPSSLICKVLKGGEVINLGDTVDMTPIDDAIGVKLQLSTYDANCYNNVTNTYSHVSTRVLLKCRGARRGQELPYGPVIYQTGPCAYDIVFYKNELCPLCTDNDFYLYRSECHDNPDGTTTAEERYLRKQDVAYTCFGGIDRTTNVTSVPCCMLLCHFFSHTFSS